MSADTHWAGLLRAALLGTARQPPPAVTGDGDALDRALASVDAETPEGTLLAQAAIVSAYRRAARIPARDERPLATPAPAETRPVVPPAAAHHLAAMLGGAFTEALPEWVGAVADAGFVVPPEWIAPLLDAAAKDARLRPRLAEVAGARGRWLAAQRTEWAFLSGGEAADDLRAAWETTAAEHRAGLLAFIRMRDPALGRELLRSTWEHEAPRTRPALVDALAFGVSMEDEEFLESLLAARSKELRAAASGLLARLAGSRLVARMTERARQAVSINQGKTGLIARLTGGGGPALEVQLPEARDKAMERDGITPTPPGRIGERAWWLLQ
ncbi:MAG: hypothetical protein JO306_10295, partial [Gemmatimonadetes bacterium]|nr:hypothetical protein [Gemmatimonadota bacterium]